MLTHNSIFVEWEDDEDDSLDIWVFLRAPKSRPVSGHIK